MKNNRWKDFETNLRKQLRKDYKELGYGDDEDCDELLRNISLMKDTIEDIKTYGVDYEFSVLLAEFYILQKIKSSDNEVNKNEKR